MRLGTFQYVLRVGPATLNEALQFCNAESPMPMVLYKPSYESLHNAVYEEVSKYGATTFWTQAKLENGEMAWMWVLEIKYYICRLVLVKLSHLLNNCSDNSTTTMPDWINDQWEATQDYKRKGDCTIVGLNDRKNQISSVECETEVADIICQPS